jgi:hypothetical protein
VLADLPRQVAVQTLAPRNSECCYLPAAPPQPTNFGAAVAIRDGFAFVGMPFALTTGRVAVFTQTTSGWVRTGTLTASDKTSGDEFGRDISFRDGLAIVVSNRAAYVFKRVNGVWRQAQRIVPPAADNALYGRAVKHEAGVLAVGASVAPDSHGVVYIYQQDATGKFIQRARVQPSDSASSNAFNAFGTALSMNNRIIVVGAPTQERTRPGAAYIFGRNSGGQWVQRQKLIAAGVQVADGFGTAVAIDRDMILVGAPFTAPEGGELGPPTTDDHIAAGMLYGFVPGTGRYVEAFRSRPTPDELLAYDGYGKSIAMFGERVVISAAEPAIPMQTQRDFVFAYTRTATALTPLAFISIGLYDVDLSMSNNLLLIGSPFDDACRVEGCIGAAHIVNLSLVQ